MRKIINQGNLLIHLKKRAIKAKFINAYPVYSTFFTSSHIKIDSEGGFIFSDTFPHPFRRRLSTTTCMMLTAGEKPFNEEDVRRENSLYQDFSNKILIDRGLSLPLFTPEKAADILYKLSTQFDVILYEYFQTDLYAHRYPRENCIQLILELDRFIGRLISQLDKNKTTLVLTSDHGNIEDLSGPLHTTNPVPLLVWGKHRTLLAEQINDLSQVTPQILNFVTDQF